MINNKRCSKCGETKPHDQFYKNKRRPDGLRHHCKQCVSGYRDLGKERTYAQQWVDRNPEAAMIRGAKHRAKTKGLDFDIDIHDIIIPETCPVFGFPLTRGLDRSRGNCSATLDRIDNEKGYVKGNVIVVSWMANCIKRNFTAKQIRAVADFYDALEIAA